MTTYGLCNLGIVPVRAEPSDRVEMVTQLLYGDHFTILDKKKQWHRIQIAFDGYKGWVDDKQFAVLSEADFQQLDKQAPKTVSEPVDFVSGPDGQLITVTMGASLNGLNLLRHQYDAGTSKQVTGNPETSSGQTQQQIIETALSYLNTPYLWGGKTPFGIDCSGFTQMVYKINGVKLLRDAAQQARQGTALSFIEESAPGDLAFFENAEGEITHVGILLKDNHIIHAYGKVRIDRLDHTGIYNEESRDYSHRLRVIRKYF